jgi:hypothetical protein
MTIGQWDAGLFIDFHKSKGERRRLLADRLIQQNEPLIKILVAQLLGIDRDQTKRRGLKVRSSRVYNREMLTDWDEALNAGRLGFYKALEAFDPSRGKISGYARNKIEYELQKLGMKAGIISTDREAKYLAPVTAATEDDAHFERIVHESSDDADEWERQFDVDDEDVEDKGLPPLPVVVVEPEPVVVLRPKKVISVPRVERLWISPLERWVAEHCRRGPSARVQRWEAWNAWALDCQSRGDAIPTQAQFVRELSTAATVWDTWTDTHRGSSARVIAGIRLCV